MDKQQLTEKTAEVLRPFELGNLIDSLQHLTVKQVFSHPAVLFFIFVVFFYGVIRRSKTVLLTLFALLCIIVIMRYAMPGPGEDLSIKAMLPFIGGGLFIGAVVIYFTFVKIE